MAKTAKPQPGQLAQRPLFASDLGTNFPSTVESYILDSRMDVKLKLQKLEHVRLMILRSINLLFSKPSLLELEKDGMRTTWAEIDGITSEIIAKLNLTGDRDSEVPKNEFARMIGFGNYDNLALCIKKGKESEKRIDLN